MSFNTIFLLVVSWKILIILIPIIGTFIGINFAVENSTNIKSEIDANVTVVKKINSGVIAEYNNSKIYFKAYDNFAVDDVVHVKSSDVRKIDNGSSFNMYLKSQGVRYICNLPTVDYVYSKHTLRREINSYFIRGPAYYSRYAPLLLLGNRNNKNEEIISKLSNISIIHLFTISGFHINIVLLLFSSLFKLLKVKNKYLLMSPYLFVLFYVIIMGIPIAATRALIFAFLCSMNKHFFENRFHKLNLLSLTMLILFFINPYVLFSQSFIFTFLITYAIVLVTSSKNKKRVKLKVFVVGSLFSLFIGIVTNKEVNISLIFTTLIFTPIISFSYILVILFFWLKPAIDNYFLLIDTLINMFQYLKLSFYLSIDANWMILVFSFTFISILICIEKPLIENVDLDNKNRKWYSNFLY